MNTKFIGVKDFRQNIANYAKKAQNKSTRFVVMNRNKPLFEIKPFADDVYLDSFVESVLEAEREVKKGNFVTEEEIIAEFIK